MKRLALRALGVAVAAAGLALAGWIACNLVAPTPAFDGLRGHTAKALVLGAALAVFGFGLFKRAGEHAPREARPAADRGPVTLDHVRALVAEGRKIAAIKVYRDLTGLGLADAQKAVAELDRVPVTLDRVRALVAEGRKIEAIKRYRELTGAGLADAQHAVAELDGRAA